MSSSSASVGLFLRFGVFELDCQAGELHKSGLLVHLPPQPLKILALLAGHSGEVVTRADIRRQIWGDGTFVDFEQGLNQCIRQIRTALGDDAESPRYIETLPRRGYRFIARVEERETPAASMEESGGEIHAHKAAGRKWLVPAGGVIAAGLALLVFLNVPWMRNRVMRAFGVVHNQPVEIHSIAVLPLENLSNDPEQEYFADGMTEELITDLGKISALRVISRTSVMRYKGTKKPLPQIARELNVDAIVEGTVEHSGNRVRITANLLYALSERHLWAESYQRDLRDVLSLQDEVARAIAQQIQAKVTPDVQTRLATSRPVNPEAHDLYLKGRYLMDRPEFEANLRALTYFQQANRIDAGSPMPYLGLASYYEMLVHYGEMRGTEARERAMAAVMRALEIDPNLAEAHAMLGSVMHDYDWDWAGAEREFKRAIELNPNSADAHDEYRNHLIDMGRFHEAYAELKLGQQLEPVWPRPDGREYRYYWDGREYDKALELGRKSVELEPNNPYSYAFVGWPLVQLGRYGEAISEFEKAVALAPGDLYLKPCLARAYAEGGREVEARKILRELELRYRQSYMRPYLIALIYVGLRENGKALEWLERAYQDRDSHMAVLKIDPWMDPLRSDPRFQTLVRRMNFPQ